MDKENISQSRFLPKAHALIALVVSFILLQSIYTLSAYFEFKRAVDNSVVALEKRIALDLPRLDLPHARLNAVGNEFSTRRYLTQLNQSLASQGLPIRVSDLQGMKSNDANSLPDAVTVKRTLMAPGRNINVSLSVSPFKLMSTFSWLALCLSFGFAVLIFLHSRIVRTEVVSDAPDAIKVAPKLIFDLKQKVLRTNINQVEASLANKPLCFYLALIEYCSQNPDVMLNPNKDVPEELAKLADKYFYRLIELGHTIRKRPNFSNSLEKTLSEIRAALDELLMTEPALKKRFYPPKAHGEGSRSKLHNYGLQSVSCDDIEIIGK